MRAEQGGRARKLGELLRGIVAERDFGAHSEQMVSGVFDDSRRVRGGGLFVAVRGTQTDGRSFVGDALRRGASVLVGEELEPAADALVLNVDDARAALAGLAARWYELDNAQGQELKLIGVTGTNGKSTTVHMTCAILRAAGWRCGMFATTHYDLCSRSIKARLTTPGPLELAAHLRECADAGAEAAVLELSSHALHQKRTDGFRFSAAVFTNLTRDHLDYHGTFEAYRAAKARLFERLDESTSAVVNVDDANHEELLRHSGAPVVTYSLDRAADIKATVSRNSIDGTIYRLRIDGRDLLLKNTLIGRHNVYNAAAAAALAHALGVPPDAIVSGLNSVRNIPGRLQRVPCMRGVEVFVDYAHTDDALRNALSVLRPLTRKRLIVVFGCGGDRDRTKRPLMARTAARFAHAVVVTSDNPRTEDPQAIIDDILPGFDADARRRVLVEPDRRRAIHAALAGAGAGDVVLIAGKGHEDYQVLGTRRVHFDDVEVAIQAGAESAQVGQGVS